MGERGAEDGLRGARADPCHRLRVQPRRAVRRRADAQGRADGRGAAIICCCLLPALQEQRQGSTKNEAVPHAGKYIRGRLAAAAAFRCTREVAVQHTCSYQLAVAAHRCRPGEARRRVAEGRRKKNKVLS